MTVADNSLELISHLDFEPRCEWGNRRTQTQCDLVAEWSIHFTACRCGKLVSTFCTDHQNMIVEIIRDESDFWCAKCRVPVEIEKIEKL